MKSLHIHLPSSFNNDDELGRGDSSFLKLVLDGRRPASLKNVSLFLNLSTSFPLAMPDFLSLESRFLIGAT